MKIVVIGGTGLIGKQLVSKLRALGHEVVAAAPSSGVNAVTGEGLPGALAHTSVVVDVSNSPSFENDAALTFFQSSAKHLREAELAAGVKHHVALSVVGTERLLESGYFRAKLAQEQSIREFGVPYTLVRATQFLEFLPAIAGSGTQGNEVRLPAAFLQPIASSDVAGFLAEYAVGAAVNGTVEIAGPQRAPMFELVQRYLTATGDARKAVRDDHASYFGAMLQDDTLVPSSSAARLGATTLDAWIANQKS